MTWDWSNARQDETGGWRITNDLGYAIYITYAALVNAVVLCPDAAGLFALQIADVGHGGGKPI